MKKLLIMTFALGYTFLSYCQLGLDSGLIAYYALNNNLKDSAKYKLHGTLSDGSYTTDRFGKASSAFLCDGSNDYFAINKFGKYIPTGDFTISLWAKSVLNITSNTMMLYNDNTSNRVALSLYYSHNGQGAFFWDYGSIANRIFIEPVSPSGKWEYFVVYFNSKTKKIGFYRDMKLLQETAVTTTYSVDSTRNLRIGMGKDGYYNGSLDDIRFYSRLLDTSEMRKLYTQKNLDVKVPGKVLMKVGISPNPVNSVLTIDFNSPALISRHFSLYLSEGRLVYENTIHSLTEEIDMSRFPNGIYVLEVDGLRLVDQKIIKN